ncbi:MAG: hypothetical protein ACOXZI_05730 [Candidatus Cryptobacteroides sp.]
MQNYLSGANCVLSLSAIAVVLLVSSIISVLEYRSVSSYVSDKIAENIHNINVAQKLADQSGEYNLAILALVGRGELGCDAGVRP